MTSPSIDYTNKDYETIRAALEAHIRAKFPNTWKDFTQSSVGMALLELTAYCFDVLSYYLDSMANEVFLPTARDRESILLLCSLIGYKLRPATSASVTATATLETAQSYDVVIPAYTEVSTEAGVKFETLEDWTIPTGDTSLEITLSQGLTITDEFESDGSAFQEFQLSQAPLIDDSLEVTVNGYDWDEVESLVYSGGSDQSWSLRTDVDDYGYVKFGDGTSGQIPPVGATIVCRYRVGGGIVGNIPTGDLNTSVTGTLVGTSPEQTVDITLVNEERGSGGEERETLDHARYWAPKSVSTNGRAVTEQDFDTLANTFVDSVYGSVAYAKAELKNRVPEENTVVIWAWGRDYLGSITTPSDNLKSALSTYFNNNESGAVRIITVDVEVEDGYLMYIDLDVGVYPDGLLSDSETINGALAALRAVFDSEANQPGTPVRLSKLYSAIQSVSGVDHSLIQQVVASYWKTEDAGVSDGITTQFDYTTQELPLPSTLTLTAGGLTITDDGDGNLIGDVDEAAENTVDYDTGELNFTLSEPVEVLTTVVARYRYPLTCLRSETDVQSLNGVNATFKGQLSFFPVVPSTLAFTDGNQVITDDGNGRLVGDKDDAEVCVIDYDTGAYEFTFEYAPSADQEIAVSYYQRLKITVGDIPVEKSQLAIEGNFRVSLLES